jgi:hypothetical protein
MVTLEYCGMNWCVFKSSAALHAEEELSKISFLNARTDLLVIFCLLRFNLNFMTVEVDTEILVTTVIYLELLLAIARRHFIAIMIE